MRHCVSKEFGFARLIYRKTEDQAADVLTKALDKKTFERHRKTIMNLDSDEHGN